MASPDAEAAAIASRQLGIITTEQAHAVGLDHSAIHHRVSSGRWLRIGRGLLVMAGVPPTWSQRVLALCLATGGVASHLTAARLHRLRPLARTAEPEVTIPRGGSARSALGRIHRAGDTGLIQISAVGVIPATDLGRTLLDLGTVVATERHAAILDDALDRGLVGLDELANCLDRHRSAGRRGVARLARLLVERGGGSSVTESVFERRFLTFCRERELPEPETQVVVHDERGPVGRCDVVFRASRLVIELDGRRGHGQLTHRSADVLRDQRLLAVGWSTMRVTWRQFVDDPDSLAARVALLTRTTS